MRTTSTLRLFALSLLLVQQAHIFSQNISVNTTGAAAGSTNMFEVTQSSTAAYMVAIHAIHNASNLAADSGYAFKAIKTGATGNNVAAYFSATGGGSNSAIIVPRNQGFVGLGTTNPRGILHIENGEAKITFYDTDAAGPNGTRPAWQIGPSGAQFMIRSTPNHSTYFTRMVMDTVGNTVLGDGTFYGESRLSLSGTKGNNDAVLTAEKRDGTTNPVFSVLPWDGQVYLSAGTYYSNGAWVHNSNSANSHIFTLQPGSGTLWYASSNSSASWNVTSGVTLWDDNADWKALVRSTRVGDSYFTGGNLGVGITTPLSSFHTTGNLTVGNAATAGSPGNVQLTMGGASPIANRLTFGTDGTGWKFAISKNQAGTVTDYLTVQDNGMVGIGTTSPGNLLAVNGTAVFGGTTGTSGEPIEVQGALSGVAHKDRDGTSTRWVHYASGGSMRLWNDANGNRTEVTTAGLFGIGTTPSEMLHVRKDQDAKTRIYLQNATSGVSATAELFLRRADNNNVASFGIGDQGYTGTTYPVDFRGAYAYTDAPEGITLRTDGAGSPIRFTTLNGASVPTEAMRIAAGGNVGIGTTSPVGKFQVDEANSIITNGYGVISAVDITPMAADVGAGLALRGQYTSGGLTACLGGIKAGKSNATSGDFGGYLSLFSRSSSTTLITERMRITENGKVGIGTTTPFGPLQVHHTIGAEGTMFTSTAALGALHFLPGNVDNGYYNNIVADDDNVIVFGPSTTAGTALSICPWQAATTGLRLYCPTNASMLVGINRRPTTYALEVNGTIWANGAAIVNGSTTWSDARYKTGVNTLENSLENILKLRGVSYDWRYKDFPDKNFPEGLQIGVIAQEIEKVYPQLVFTDKDGYKSVDYSKLTPILLEAMKQQQEMIDALKAENREMKSNNDFRLRQLEELLGVKAQR